MAFAILKSCNAGGLRACERRHPVRYRAQHLLCQEEVLKGPSGQRLARVGIRAGLSVALNLAETRRVAILAKRAASVGASAWAQGGIAAVPDSADSVDNHVDDTLVAGGGLCDEAATRFIVENGRAAIEWLIDEGVPFTRNVSAELQRDVALRRGSSPTCCIAPVHALPRAEPRGFDALLRHRTGSMHEWLAVGRHKLWPQRTTCRSTQGHQNRRGVRFPMVSYKLVPSRDPRNWAIRPVA